MILVLIVGKSVIIVYNGNLVLSFNFIILYWGYNNYILFIDVIMSK